MTYLTRIHNEQEVAEVTAVQAEDWLSRVYKPAFVEYLFTHNIHFRLLTPFRDIWTEDNRMVPMAGFYGTIEEVPDLD